MAMTILKRQLITDSTGQPVGVILPWDEFVRVEKYLDEQEVVNSLDDKLAQIRDASTDPLYLADLAGT